MTKMTFDEALDDIARRYPVVTEALRQSEEADKAKRESGGISWPNTDGKLQAGAIDAANLKA